MSESEPKHVGRDAVGIALFGAATFAAISLYMAEWRPVEDPRAGVITGAATSVVEALGAVPALVLAVGVALLGARIWLFSRGDDLVRNLLGLVGVSAGMSVLAGAVAVDAGGMLGAWSGGKVTAFMSQLVSIPFGLACLLLPVWLAWARPRDPMGYLAGTGEPESESKSAIWGQERVRSAAPPPTEAEGVSAAEAAALLPTVPPEAAVYEPPPSPYPEDVRLEGRIPEGAQPIYTDDQQRPDTLEDSSHEAALLAGAVEAPSAGPQPAGEDLAGSAAGPFAVRAEGELRPSVEPGIGGFRLERRPAAEASPAGPPVGTGATGTPVEPAEPIAEQPTYPEGTRPLAPEFDASVRPLESPRSGASPIETADLPPPSWEQSGLFTEEPVDAYGTPLSVLESHRGAGEAGAVVDPPDPNEVSLAERVAAGEVPEAELAEGDPELTETVLAVGGAVQEVETDEDEEDEEEEYEDEEVLAEADEEEEDEDEEEAEEDEDEEVLAEADEEEEEEDEEEAEEDEDEEVLAEADEEEEDEDEEEAEEYEDEEVLAEADEEEEEEDEEEAEEYEDEEVLAEADEEEEDEDEEEAEEDEDEEVLAEADEEEEDEDEEEAEEPEDEEVLAEAEEPAEEPAVEEAVAERAEPEVAVAEEPEPTVAKVPEPEVAEVTVQPQAAPAAPAAAAAEPGLSPNLVHEAGVLFLQRGRVAVSMLQREYGLDFSQSTAVLDQLQEQGLIGPYMGGQRRDILMTLEEWEQRAATT